MWNVKQKQIVEKLELCFLPDFFTSVAYNLFSHKNTSCSYQDTFRHCPYCIEPSSYTSQDAAEIVKMSEIHINGNVTEVFN